MRIGEFSQATGLSPDTLRYYEKIGLMTAPLRDHGGQRVYQPRDLDWARFVVRLRDTGMPVAEMCRYARARAEGAQTAPERRALLAAHRDRVRARLTVLTECLSVLDAKITGYDQEDHHADTDRNPRRHAGRNPS